MKQSRTQNNSTFTPAFHQKTKHSSRKRWSKNWIFDQIQSNKQLLSFGALFLLMGAVSKFTLFAQPTAGIPTPVSVGEFVDKITILQIKSERIHDEKKLINVRYELEQLLLTHKKTISNSPELEQLTAELKQVNEALWEIEDAIRDKEAMQEFDNEFIQIARSVYKTNDQRCALKRQISLLLKSQMIEEKGYKKWKS